MIKWTVLLLAVILNALANILIKAGTKQIGHFSVGTLSELLSLVTNPCLVTGLISFALALIAYSSALTRLELSVAYPLMTSLGLIIVSVASLLLFHEGFGFQKILGTIFILLGVVLVSGKF